MVKKFHGAVFHAWQVQQEYRCTPIIFNIYCFPPQQQQLHKRAWTLRFTYIVWLIVVTVDGYVTERCAEQRNWKQLSRSDAVLRNDDDDDGDV
jgi:hypothetical protein